MTCGETVQPPSTDKLLSDKAVLGSHNPLKATNHFYLYILIQVMSGAMLLFIIGTLKVLIHTHTHSDTHSTVNQGHNEGV